MLNIANTEQPAIIVPKQTFQISEYEDDTVSGHEKAVVRITISYMENDYYIKRTENGITGVTDEVRRALRWLC